MGPIEREVVDLEPLLKPLEAWAADAWNLYDKIAKPGWPHRARQSASIVEMARDLARMTERQEKGQRFVPLLAFVEGLCDRIKQGKDLGEAGPLEGWLEKTMQALGVSRGVGAALIEYQRPVVGGYVLVQIRPLQFAEGAAARGGPGYGVKAWLRGTDRDQALLGGKGGGEIEKTLHDVEAGLPALLSQCRDELLALGVSLDSIRFELVVPRILLGIKFDRMPVALDLGGEIPLGAVHRVVVRPLERSDPGRQFQMLSRYKAAFGRELDPCSVIESLNYPSCGSLEAYLIRGGALSGIPLYLGLTNRVTCCVCLLVDPPPPKANDAQNDLFYTLLRAYVPAVIWLREGPPAGDPCDELCCLVRGHPLCQIPERIYEARREAEENPGVPWHRGRHLTLLWDDPRRPPSPDADPANRFRSSR